jgi:SAM-dependent methyltransferase
MGLNFFDFLRIGREQSYLPRPWPIRLFTRLFGPLGLHSRIRSANTINAIQHLHLPVDAHILDAGSGRGLTLFWLAQRYINFKLHGIERDEVLVVGCREIATRLGLDNLTFDQGDLSQCVDLGGPYDLIISIDVLEHIEDDVGVLRKMYQALTPTGKLLLHLPLHRWDQHRIFSVFKKHIIHDHVRDEYTPDEIQTKLRMAGFAVHQLAYGFGPLGELAFELNAMFWDHLALRAVMALLTYPLALLLAYLDIRHQHERGNSMIIVATRDGLSGLE